jgi:hypothetical protein
MRTWLGSFILMAALTATPAAAGSLTLDQTYVQQDGSIMSYPNVRNFIDPYFPTKALILANDSGMNVSPLAHGWINWLLARQEPNGLFSRFCLNEKTNHYAACMVADADDSMMAMWIELLYRSAPNGGMPDHWQQSVAKAQTRLDELYNHQNNIYFISKALPVGLLMDNIEIYASLKRSAFEARRLGELQQSAAFHAKAARLKAGILDTFWDKDVKRFLVSTQTRSELAFYPDFVAQLMPMLHNFRSHRVGAYGPLFTAWMQSHKREWMGLIGKDYPWGLVAVVATQRKDIATANCWIQHVATHRHGSTWNIVDEAAYQAVDLSLKKAWPEGSPVCEGAIS